MRRFLLGVCLALVLGAATSWAFAEAESIPKAVVALYESAYPGYQIAASAGGDSPVILCLSKEKSKVLVVAEKDENGAYTLTVQNDRAISDGETVPSLLLDTDGQTLFISMQNSAQIGYRYACTLDASSRWGDVSAAYLGHLEEWTGELFDGFLRIHYAVTDKEGNLLRQIDFPPIYASDLTASRTLYDFDMDGFILARYAALSHSRGQLIADKYLPAGATVTSTCIITNALGLIADGEDGARRLYVLEYRDGGYSVAQSSPLPSGASFDDFHSWNDFLVYISNEMDYVSIGRQFSGTWSIIYIGATDWFSVGENYVDDEQGILSNGKEQRYYGYTPWNDIATLDFSALPKTVAEAIKLLDQNGWALVNNPNPADRLHLRVRPDKDAASLGKYYSGTPVCVLSQSGEWSRVSVAGVKGYMMTKYLAFGKDMQSVRNAFPDLSLREDLYVSGIPLYEAADTGANLVTFIHGNVTSFTILGVAGDEWYHVIFDREGLAGYVKQDCCWPGNG